MSYDITVKGGTSVRLPTAGKYCYQDIIVTAESGGSAEENQLDARLVGTLKEINSSVSSVTNYACYGLSSLEVVNLPNATTIGIQAFRACTSLTTFNAPKVTSISSSYCFYTDNALTEINFPLLISIGDNCFGICTKMTKADFGAVTDIGTKAFDRCGVLETLILRNTSSIATLANTNAFNSTPIETKTGYIYVPSALVDSYKSATNWSTYASQFRAIEDYPDICGG